MSFKPIDARRDEFRKYLEKSGTMDAISKAFIKLYECPERPDNPREFLRRNLGDSALDTDTIAHLKRELEDSRNEIAQLTRILGTLKLEQQKTETTPDTTIKQEANNDATEEDTGNNETISKSLSNVEPSVAVAVAPAAVDTKKIESTTTTSTITAIVPDEVGVVGGGGEEDGGGGGGAEPKPSCSKTIDDQQTAVVDSTNLPSTSSSSSTKTEDSTEKTSSIESEPNNKQE